LETDLFFFDFYWWAYFAQAPISQKEITNKQPQLAIT